MSPSRLFERFDDDDYAIGKSLGYTTMQVAWFYKSMNSMIVDFDRALEKSLASNDNNNSLMNAAFAILARMWSSQDAVEIEAFSNYTKELIDWEEDLRGGILLTVATQYVRALMGKTDYNDPDLIFDCGNHSKRRYLDWAKSHSSTPQRVVSNYAQFLLPVLYVYGHYEAAIEIAERDILPYQGKYWSFASRVAASTRQFISLAYLAVSPFGVEDEAIQQRLQFVDETLGQATIWSTVNDINVFAWSTLILALRYEREGSMNDAVKR